MTHCRLAALVFLLLSTGEGGEHLTALACVARTLRGPDSATTFRTTPASSDIIPCLVSTHDNKK